MEIEMKAIIEDLESKFTKMESDLMRLLKGGFIGLGKAEVCVNAEIRGNSRPILEPKKGRNNGFTAF